jgi:hypothetical protein
MESFKHHLKMERRYVFWNNLKSFCLTLRVNGGITLEAKITPRELSCI